MGGVTFQNHELLYFGTISSTPLVLRLLDIGPNILKRVLDTFLYFEFAGVGTNRSQRQYTLLQYFLLDCFRNMVCVSSETLQPLLWLINDTIQFSSV